MSADESPVARRPLLDSPSMRKQHQYDDMSRYRICRLFTYCVMHGDAFRPRRTRDAWRRCEVDLLTPGQHRVSRVLSRVFETVILAFILTNIVLTIYLSTLDKGADDSLNRNPGMRLFTIVSLGVFAAEYLARLWCCVEDIRYRHQRPFVDRLLWACSALALIDLIALASYPLWLAVNTQGPTSLVLRIIRVFRIFSFFRMERQLSAFKRLGQVMRAARNELLVAMFVALGALLLASCVMYVIESTLDGGTVASDLGFDDDGTGDKHNATARAQSEFRSIPRAMWWAVNVLTTDGCGGMEPRTLPGKIVASAVAVVGIMLFALPAGILGARFTEAAVRADVEEFSQNVKEDPAEYTQASSAPRMGFLQDALSPPRGDTSLSQLPLTSRAAMPGRPGGFSPGHSSSVGACGPGVSSLPSERDLFSATEPTINLPARMDHNMGMFALVMTHKAQVNALLQRMGEMDHTISTLATQLATLTEHLDRCLDGGFVGKSRSAADQRA